ncbi:MAG: thymidylate synthase [Candidatus Bilamarchaeaceae archaeon]
MIIFDEHFGHSIYGKTLGETWLNVVECVLKNGCLEFDENRARLALQALRVKSETQILPDSLFEKYANKERINKMIDLVYRKETMEDFDITPSFRAGAKSYYTRIKEGRMIEFVVHRLTCIPESKKAVMVFPTYEDYAQVISSPYNDYLPCIVSLQFRLRPQKDGSYKINTFFNMRSQDVFQKMPGDLTIFAMLTRDVAKKLEENLKKKIVLGSLDGMITDAHIYKNTYDEAHEILTTYLNSCVSDSKNS